MIPAFPRPAQDWIFLSKNAQDQYINMLARGVGAAVTDSEDFVYEHSDGPIVLRGILKYKIMQRCWRDHRDFYYMDSGYFGNTVSRSNPRGWKLWHRIVPNDLQHHDIIPRPGDRWDRLDIELPQQQRRGKTIVLALPDSKPCRFYGIDQQTWTDQTLQQIRAHSDRPIMIRQRSPQRSTRVFDDPLQTVLAKDVHCLVTFNSAAAIESILMGVPAFVLSPTHAASPVANRDLSKIENPYWPDRDKLLAWAHHLAYGQFHVTEFQDGTAIKILKGL